MSDTVGAMADGPRQKQRPLFRRLTPRQAREMGAEKAAAHQRARLMGAMIAAVDQHGYAGVSVDMLASLAGISKSAFYGQFDDKEDCFLATFDEIVGQGVERIRAAADLAPRPRERPRAAFTAFLDLLAEAGPPARLVFLASLEVGVAALGARERAAAPFRQIFLESIGAFAGRDSDVYVRAFVGGVQEVVYRRLRDDEPERLRDDMEELLEWGLLYRPGRASAGSVGARLLAGLDTDEWPGQAETREGLWDWAGPLATAKARGALSQRERILRATAQVAVEGGYPRLSIGAISARAGTSNQTFYENFGSKQEAFLAAFDTLALRAYGVISAAFETRKGAIDAGAAGMAAMLGLLARDTLYSRLAFIELPAAGRAGWERAETMLEIFIAFLEPAELPAGIRERPPRVVLEAVGGGIWTVVRQEIVGGRGSELPTLAADLIDFSLLPFGVE